MQRQARDKITWSLALITSVEPFSGPRELTQLARLRVTTFSRAPSTSLSFAILRLLDDKTRCFIFLLLFKALQKTIILDGLSNASRYTGSLENWLTYRKIQSAWS